MDPEQHDRSLALTSHLPHLLASALAGILPPELNELTAGGFRDTTRIAAGDPSITTPSGGEPGALAIPWTSISVAVMLWVPDDKVAAVICQMPV